MKRHVALIGLSSDHHHGLVHARHLSRAAAGKEDAERAARAYLAYAAEDQAHHFREEEEVLLPEYANVVGVDQPLIAQAVVEHVAIRALTLALERALLEDEPFNAVLEELGKKLEAHIRFEERRLFPAIEKALTEERLAAVGVLMAAGLPGG